ncbi:MAG: sulfotransferase [Sphingobacteriales bacterium]|nr:sulfotransferase [Sphingobacteriales bacterium]
MNFIDASTYYVRMQTHLKFVHIHCIKRPSPRRFIIGILYFIVLNIVGITNTLWRLMDEILFPNYREIEIKQPVFIISNPRSGSTFMHRLMCLDEEKFVFNLLYQTTFPSITFYRMMQFFNTVDKKIGMPLHKLLDFVNGILFKGWDDIHATGFNKSDEDEGLHFISGISPSVGLVTPFLNEFKELYIPDKLDAKSREDIKKFYLATIQRWMYALGSDKIFLSKTVMSSGRLELLQELFPDVKIVFLVRSPYQAIPSFTSMFAEPWSLFYPDIPKNSDAYREWGELGIEYYKYFNEKKLSFKKENLMTISYNDFVLQPKETILKIYEQLKLEITPEFRERLENATSSAKQYTSKHSYSLETYGFDKEHICRELNFIFEEFGFEK